jgi:hypothetical protein
MGFLLLWKASFLLLDNRVTTIDFLLCTTVLISFIARLTGGLPYINIIFKIEEHQKALLVHAFVGKTLLKGRDLIAKNVAL